MIANFFQSLSDRRVAYLLISGQATVLYGAATFSEDIDLWIEPTLENTNRFISVLRDCGARYYKLTPALTATHCTQGHGFHFVLPAETAIETFLDVTGAPPRVGAFGTALPAANLMDTDWGTIPTVGVKDLVEIKKTQRLEDYPIISRLALNWLGRPECTKSSREFSWTAKNIFTLEAMRQLFLEHPAALDALSDSEDAAIQELDRRYWRRIIAELKLWRSEGRLMTEGEEV